MVPGLDPEDGLPPRRRAAALGLNQLMGSATLDKARNANLNLEEGRIAVVLGVFEQTAQ